MLLPGGSGLIAQVARGSEDPTCEVMISMRPISVFANGLGSEIERLRGADLRGQW